MVVSESGYWLVIDGTGEQNMRWYGKPIFALHVPSFNIGCPFVSKGKKTKSFGLGGARP